VADRLVAEAADLIRAFGFLSSHVVLIGGLVPGLLVPVLDPGLDPHVGTGDIDLCLSMALVEGETETYERIETVLKRHGFREADVSFRWTRKSGLALTVEFFCPAGEGRPSGRAFRPLESESPTAKANFGGRLSALALEAGGLLTTDIEVVTRHVTLPDAKGALEVQLNVTGPLAFLVAKTDALHRRDKPKDAYDLVWLIECWPGGPAAAAAAFAVRPAYATRQVADAMKQIRTAFADNRAIGARSYARFLDNDSGEQARLERRAVGAVAEFLAALPVRD
jgi:hypothetical protein